MHPLVSISVSILPFVFGSVVNVDYVFMFIQEINRRTCISLTYKGSQVHDLAKYTAGRGSIACKAEKWRGKMGDRKI